MKTDSQEKKIILKRLKELAIGKNYDMKPKRKTKVETFKALHERITSKTEEKKKKVKNGRIRT